MPALCTSTLGTQKTLSELGMSLSRLLHHKCGRSRTYTCSTRAVSGVSQNLGHKRRRHGGLRWYSVPPAEQITNSSTLHQEELELLHYLVHQANARRRPSPPPLATEAVPGPRSSSSDLRIPQSWPDHQCHDEHAARASLDPHKVFQSAQATAAYLRSLVAEAVQLGDLSQRSIADLPATTFTELLRSLDPLSTADGQETGPAANPNLPLDLATGLRIGPGHALYSPLGQFSDTWGARISHVLLFRRVVAAAKLRIQAGNSVALSDFKLLLRFAGAAGDPVFAKSVWHLMDRLGWPRVMRDGEAYTEMTRARFLTEPLYMQWDRARFRVKPINLFRQKWAKWTGSRAVGAVEGASSPAETEFQSRNRQLDISITRLRHIAASMASDHTTRYGQSRHELDKVDYLTRMLRKHKPARKVLSMATSGPYAADEPLLSALVIALGRSGSFRLLQTAILAKVWGIDVRLLHRTDLKSGSYESFVSVAQNEQGASDPHDPSSFTTINGLRRDSPLYPSERLLLAVAEAYGSNANIAVGLRIIDALSRRYGVSITDRVWSVLLEWTYIQASRPASTEWREAGWPGKVLSSAAVEIVYNTMVSEPYCVRPTFAHSVLLVKSLIARNRLRESTRRMLDELMPAYHKQLMEVERLYCRQALVRGLLEDESRTSRSARTKSIREPVDDPTGATPEWLAARVRAEGMRFEMQLLCRSLLKRVRSRDAANDDWTLRSIPQLVDTLREVMPRKVEYAIATGKVLIEMTPSPFDLQAGAGTDSDASVDAHGLVSQAARTRERVGLTIRRHRRMNARVWKPVMVSGDVAPPRPPATHSKRAAHGGRKAVMTREEATDYEDVFDNLLQNATPHWKWPHPPRHSIEFRDIEEEMGVKKASRYGRKWGRRRTLIKAMRLGTVRWRAYAFKTWWDRIDR